MHVQVASWGEARVSSKLTSVRVDRGLHVRIWVESIRLSVK